MDHAMSAARPWTIEEVQILIELARERVSCALIAIKMKRTEEEIHVKAGEIGVSLTG